MFRGVLQIFALIPTALSAVNIQIRILKCKLKGLGHLNSHLILSFFMQLGPDPRVCRILQSTRVRHASSFLGTWRMEIIPRL